MRFVASTHFDWAGTEVYRTNGFFNLPIDKYGWEKGLHETWFFIPKVYLQYQDDDWSVVDVNGTYKLSPTKMLTTGNRVNDTNR